MVAKRSRRIGRGELDRRRREALVEVVRSGPGQAVISTTDLEHVPGAEEPDVTRIEVRDGVLLQEALAG